MTDSIFQLARKGGISQYLNGMYSMTEEQLEAFAELVRADERAKFGEPVAWKYEEKVWNSGEWTANTYSEAPPHQNPNLSAKCKNITPLYSVKDIV